jgi:hypothetical protein
MSNEVVLPIGWEVSGEFPDVVVPDALGEDIVQYRSPGRRFTVDIGWYPELDPDGEFYCRTIIDSAWDDPDEEIKTRDLRAVREWTRRTLTRLSQLSAPIELSPVSVEARESPVEMSGTLGADRSQQRTLSPFVVLYAVPAFYVVEAIDARRSPAKRGSATQHVANQTDELPPWQLAR